MKTPAAAVRDDAAVDQLFAASAFSRDDNDGMSGAEDHRGVARERGRRGGDSGRHDDGDVDRSNKDNDNDDDHDDDVSLRGFDARISSIVAEMHALPDSLVGR